ncbi:MAG: acetolactate synthase large subunit [Gammaproteobacteria bacterium]
MAKGATALLKTLADSGIEVCFTNPGTSEMHFVAALDGEPRLHAVLALFEGVATGAADGYARMRDKPAATLLHLGPGLGNGLANLHNARRARVPLVNLVGDHATFHVRFDAQLQSDIETVARNVSPDFVRTAKSPETLCNDAVAAIVAARGPPGQVATLIVPADVSWSEGAQALVAPPAAAPPMASDTSLAAAAAALRSGEPAALLLGGHALRAPGLLAAARIAAHHHVRLFAETFPTRLQRGAGLPAPERIAYLPELVAVQLAGLKHLVLVDAKAPVAFFAYPGHNSWLVPDGCVVHVLTDGAEDTVANLEKLATALGADHAEPELQAARRPGRPRGKLTAAKVCKALGYLLPENAIVVDESITSGLMLPLMTAGVPPHDLLTLTGGAIGQGLPCAVGAAIACPERPVVALAGDGAAMYTLQALWTMAREKLNVTAIIFNNAAYSILNVELARTGAATASTAAKAQLDLRYPPLDFVALARGMGVHGTRTTTTNEFLDAFNMALATPGPHLIDAVVPEALGGTKRRLLPWLLRALPGLPQPVARTLKRKIAP